jgi:hypothetical protein
MVQRFSRFDPRFPGLVSASETKFAGLAEDKNATGVTNPPKLGTRIGQMGAAQNDFTCIFIEPKSYVAHSKALAG